MSGPHPTPTRLRYDDVYKDTILHLELSDERYQLNKSCQNVRPCSSFSLGYDCQPPSPPGVFPACHDNYPSEENLLGPD